MTSLFKNYNLYPESFVFWRFYNILLTSLFLIRPRPLLLPSQSDRSLLLCLTLYCLASLVSLLWLPWQYYSYHGSLKTCIHCTVHVKCIIIVTCIIDAIHVIFHSICFLCVSCSLKLKKKLFFDVWLQLLLAILLFLLCFIISSYLQASHRVGCVVVALLLIYFPLVVFSWLLIGGIVVMADMKCWNHDIMSSDIMKFTVSGLAWGNYIN